MIPNVDTLTRRMVALERRLGELEGGTRLGNSAINEGALIARDAEGAERARFGQLEDGTFGVTGRIVGSDVTGSSISGSEIVVSSDGETYVRLGASVGGSGLALRDPSTGILVPLAQHVFGAAYRAAPDEVTRTQAAGGTESAWITYGGTGGDSLQSVTGRWLATASANLQHVGTGNSARLQVRPVLINASTGAVYSGATINLPAGVTAQGQYISQFVQTQITTPPGVLVHLRHQVRIRSGIGAQSSTAVVDLVASATPQ